MFILNKILNRKNILNRRIKNLLKIKPKNVEEFLTIEKRIQKLREELSTFT
jgi:hypothetical protein